MQFATSFFLAAVFACAGVRGLHAAPSPAAATAKKFLVVIDPGHGGSDVGASVVVGGKRVTEKEIVLALAQEISDQLRKLKVQTVLTRREDVDLPLPDRTALANRLEASVFLSIHMNSSPGQDAHWAQGIETYILNNSTEQSSKRLADLENSVLQGSSFGQKAEAYPAGGDVALILKDLTLDGNLTESKSLACKIQNKVVSATTPLADARKDVLRNRGVKQALFYVLLGADMPSVLVEAGFINNARDRQQVTSPTGRRQVAQALAHAIVDYQKTRGSAQARLELSKCLVH